MKRINAKDMRSLNRSIRWLPATLLMVFWVSSFISSAQTSMSGTYVIGSIDADYETINEALNDYRNGTIEGDVTFLLKAEIFAESVDLSSLPNGQYKFTLKGMDREGSVIRTNTSDVVTINKRKAVIGLEGARNVTLEKLTVVGSSQDEAIYLLKSDSCNLLDVNFDGVNEHSLYVATCSQIVVDHCDFKGFVETALFMQGGDSIFIQSSGFTNYSRYGIYRVSTDQFFIENNHLSSNLSVDNDIDMLMPGGGSFVISGNTIEGSVRAFTQSVSNVTIRDNVIKSDKNIALVVSAFSGSGKLDIYNNMLSSKSSLGTEVSVIAFDKINFVHNTVINGGSAEGRYNCLAFENNLSDRVESFNLSIVNNIFYGINGPAMSYFLLKSVSSQLEIDHNLLFSDTDEILKTDLFSTEDTTVQAGVYSIEQWHEVLDSSFDQNSRSFKPLFQADKDFSISNARDYRFGTFIDSIVMDINGDIRLEGQVDVGADQFFCEPSLSNWEVTVFNGFVWEGTVFDSSGTYTFDYKDVSGCDSTVKLSLQVLAIHKEIALEENIDSIILAFDTIDEVNYELGITKDEVHFHICENGLNFSKPLDYEKPLDFDEDNEYLVDIVATDKEGNRSEVELRIIIIDVDEKAPTLTSEKVILVDENISGSFYSITTSEEAVISLGSDKDEKWFILEDDELSFVGIPDFEVPFDGEDNDYVIDIVSEDSLGNLSITPIVISVKDLKETVLEAGDWNGDLKVFPNPSKDYFSIKLAGSVLFEIYDRHGRSLKSGKVPSDKINVSDFDPGIYMVELRDSAGRIIDTIKLIKQAD